MKLVELLKSRRAEVLGRWRDLILETYPGNTVRFVKGQKDRFHNPVGYSLNEGTAGILDGLLAGTPRSDLRQPMDSLVRIRTVQDLTPSDSIGFVFKLKQAVHDEIGASLDGVESWKELSKLYAAIDDLALLAFETYTQCRQEISEIRINAMKRRISTILERSQDLFGPLEDTVEPVNFQHDEQGGDEA